MDEILSNGIGESEVNLLNPLNLAFIGDAVYEQHVRERMVINHQDFNATKLHKACVSFVKASSQSLIMNFLESELTEEEERIYKRGRNTKSATVPKNAKVSDYRRATGFEALVGYLFLLKKEERLMTILNRSVEIIEEEIKNGEHKKS